MLRWLVIVLFFLFCLPAKAENLVTEPTILTPTLLQERLNAPKLNNGFYTIDLSNLIIDLTKTESSEEFYRLLQTPINRSPKPLGLDLSYSVIKGDFYGNKLGLLTSLSTPTLLPLLTASEQEQIKRDQRFMVSLQQQTSAPLVRIFRGLVILDHARFTGKVVFANSFFLQDVSAQKTSFLQGVDWVGSGFAANINFSEATFVNDANFSQDSFFAKVKFNQTRFKGTADFSNANLETEISFALSQFTQQARFNRSKFLGTADFSGVNWRERVDFGKSSFIFAPNFANGVFAKAVVFRGTFFNSDINFQDVTLLDQVDFSNAFFSPESSLNLSGLAFDSQQAKILGDDGIIGRVISLPKLQGNESVLRNLIRNFRLLQQITDANQVEYTKQRLRLQQLTDNLIFKRSSYLTWLWDCLLFLGLSLLLLLSNYGNSVGLVLGVGGVAIAYFALLFWFVDRTRRRYPKPILPHTWETLVMLSSFFFLTTLGLVEIFSVSSEPQSTLCCLSLFLFPIPLITVACLHWQGRYHDLIDVSYLTEEGSLRQLRLLIVRLPVLPRFEMFRERYLPIVWDRRWSWLYYYDFSLNNLLRLGFNDIRLRDQHLPFLVSFLVWYQWFLGVLYFSLLLWTLSRKIPGLNLLIYLR